MKRIICLLVLLVAAAACDKPRTIPDGDLKNIVREIFILNAYCDGQKANLIADSMDIYTPVFEKYGYNPHDLMFTINSMSRRKSIRFTDILDEVIDSLEKEGNVVFGRVAMIDSVDRVLARRYRQTVFSDSVPRRLTKASDLDKPDLVFPVRKGSYEITFTYLIDSTDNTPYLQYYHQLIDTTGRNTDRTFRSYSKKERKSEKITFDVTRDDVTELRMFLARTGSTASSLRKKGKKQPLRTALTIDSLTVTYYLPKDVARDSILRETFSVPAYLSRPAQKTNERDPENLSPLRPDPAGAAARRDTLVRQ